MLSIQDQLHKVRLVQHLQSPDPDVAEFINLEATNLFEDASTITTVPNIMSTQTEISPQTITTRVTIEVAAEAQAAVVAKVKTVAGANITITTTKIIQLDQEQEIISATLAIMKVTFFETVLTYETSGNTAETSKTKLRLTLKGRISSV